MADREHPHQAVLRQAFEVAQTKERLAAALEVSVLELERYMAGETPLPAAVFLKALDMM